MDATRREVLAAGAVLPLGVAGVLATLDWIGDDGESLETTAVLVEQHSYGGGGPVVTSGLSGQDEATRRAWAFDSPGDLENLNREQLRAVGGSRATTLADETEFSDSFLLVVQAVLPSIDQTLRLDRVVAHDGGVVVAVSADYGGAGGGASAEELATLFVRCSRDGVSTVDTVRVEYEGTTADGSIEART